MAREPTGRAGVTVTFKEFLLNAEQVLDALAQAEPRERFAGHEYRVRHTLTRVRAARDSLVRLNRLHQGVSEAVEATGELVQGAGDTVSADDLMTLEADLRAFGAASGARRKVLAELQSASDELADAVEAARMALRRTGRR